MAGEHNRESLPKWARDEIERLERSVEYWKTKYSVGPEDSDTFVWGGGIGGEHDKPLGKGPNIEFHVNGSDRWEHRFDVRLRGEELEVMGGDGLIVAPISGNVIRVRHR
jgi:hypothetical protein